MMDQPGGRFAAYFQATEERINRHRSLIPALCSRSALRALTGIGSDWLLILTAAWLSESVSSWPVYLLCTLLISSRINALDLSWQHEAVHCNLFTQKKWHDRLQFLYALPSMTTLGIARGTHLSHHRHYVAETEAPLSGYDYWGIDEARWSQLGYRVWIWLVRPLLAYHTYTTVRDTFLDLRDNRREAVRVLLFWGGVFGVFLGMGHGGWLVKYWLVPFLIVRPPMFFWQDLAQHFGTRTSPSRDVRGVIFEFMVTPRGRGVSHNLHHLFPGIPWFRQREASALLLDEERTDRADGFIELSRQILLGDHPAPTERIQSAAQP